MSVKRRWWLIQVLALGVGCDPPAASLAPRLQVVGSSLDDDAPVSPTATVTLRFSAPLDPATVNEATLALVRGAVDDLLRGRIERRALVDAERDRLAPVRVGLSVDGTVASVSPLRPLDAGALHTLLATGTIASGGRRLAATVERAFQTGPTWLGAPWLALRWPPAGSVGVVRNLRSLAVRFSRPVVGVDAGSLRLADDLGEVIAAAVTADGGEASYRLWPAAPLRALRRYHLEAGPAVVDVDGDALFLLDPPVGFTTGVELRAAAPTVVASDLSASSGCLVLRLRTAPAADARLCVDGDCVEDGEVAPAHELVHPLPFAASATVTVTARDESTAPPARLGPMAAPASSPRTLAIVEVLSRPLGSHYAQQYVAVRNIGAGEVSLAGLTLQLEQGASVVPDAAAGGGAGPTVPPGGLALLVPATFVADDGLDPPAAPDAVIVRLPGGRLGGRGIHVGGEAMALREPDGRLVSRFSTAGLRLEPGQSVRRVDPCDRSGAYLPSPLAGGASPGGP